VAEFERESTPGTRRLVLVGTRQYLTVNFQCYRNGARQRNYSGVTSTRSWIRPSRSRRCRGWRSLATAMTSPTMLRAIS